MIATDVRNLLTMLIALVGAVGCLLYIFTNQRRKAKKPVYALAGIGFMYIAVVYGMGLIFENYYLLRTGWLSAIGIYLLISIFVASLIVDWRKNDRR